MMTPEEMAAHKARIEYMEAMGQAHYSRTDAQWHVAHFAKAVGAELEAEVSALKLQVSELQKEVKFQESLYNDAKAARDKHFANLQESNRLIERLQNVIKDLGIAWRENWDCSAHPGHAAMDNALERADKFLWDLRCHEQIPPSGEPCSEKLPCPHHKEQPALRPKQEEVICEPCGCPHPAPECKSTLTIKRKCGYDDHEWEAINDGNLAQCRKCGEKVQG